MSEEDEANLAAYHAAVAALPVLARTVLLFRRHQRASYRDIATWLELDIETVKRIMVYANANVATIVEKKPPLESGLFLKPTQAISDAEAALFDRYADYLSRNRVLTFEGWLRHIGPTAKSRAIRWWKAR
ncbi:hypothetical protein ACFO8O_12690 [Hephaestia sp. GCM10023244]|uniref:hypothetical protein n=1 Tax=unclassified Hephaestia TaxID=2631281 RepID=UPI002076EF88|nr:hypothetical protein [Hephaestia sp. MAHUQ-44]MCM8731818.1 hypothetical protein [Hephaestia sp. MAHUQ-44]